MTSIICCSLSRNTPGTTQLKQQSAVNYLTDHRTELKAIVTVDLASKGHMKFELVLFPVQAQDLFHLTQGWMSFVCDCDLNTSDSVMCEAHPTHFQESIPETQGPCTDYVTEMESNL